MSDTIGKIYSDLIKEQFIKERLREGIIPSVEDVNEAVKELQVKFNNFNSPLVREGVYRLEIDEGSSASKMNEMFGLLSSDLLVCIKSLALQGNKMTDTYDSTYTRLEGFDRKLEKIQTRVDSLLFESKNSDRHEEIFYERFKSTEMIDLGATTAEIDDISNSLTLKSSKSSVIPLGTSVDSIEVVTERNPSVANSASLQGLEVANLVNTTNNVWQHQVRTNEPVGQLYLDVILRLPSSSKEVNKIIVEPAGGDIKTQTNLEVSYSSDKLNWQFPDGEKKKRLLSRTTLDFKNTQAEYWRIRLSKLGNDGFFGNSYVYNFGLKNVLFLGKEYEKVNRQDVSLLYSKIINPEKLDTINSINLQICEAKPFGTNIVYEMAPITGSQIADLESDTIGLVDLRYYTADLADRDSFTLDMLKLVSEPTIDEILVDDSLSYKDQNDYDYMLDEPVSSLVSKSDTVLLRNGGDNSIADNLGQTDIIRGAATGWVFSGLFYSTYVLIEEKDGQIINVGDTSIMINGKAFSGKVKLSTGLNLVTCPKENWHSIDLSSLPPTEDTNLDPLYPFNHKYLIEGIGVRLYDQDMTQIVGTKNLTEILDPEGVYSKANKNWENKVSEITFADFESKAKSTLDVFSYKVDNNSQERIVIKSTDENGLLNRERFSIITKIQNSDPIKALIFKATLTTEDIKTTPVLNEYLLKFR
jgi:hypothetical protein